MTNLWDGEFSVSLIGMRIGSSDKDYGALKYKHDFSCLSFWHVECNYTGEGVRQEFAGLALKTDNGKPGNPSPIGMK